TTRHSLAPSPPPASLPFFLNAPPPTHLSPLSLHDALPIYLAAAQRISRIAIGDPALRPATDAFSVNKYLRQDDRERVRRGTERRSEEHTSELQSLTNLVCRLLLEKKTNPTPSATPRLHIPP